MEIHKTWIQPEQPTIYVRGEKTMAKVVTMGDHVKIIHPNNEKFIQADEPDVVYGGGEAT